VRVRRVGAPLMNKLDEYTRVEECRGEYPGPDADHLLCYPLCFRARRRASRTLPKPVPISRRLAGSGLTARGPKPAAGTTGLAAPVSDPSARAAGSTPDTPADVGGVPRPRPGAPVDGAAPLDPPAAGGPGAAGAAGVTPGELATAEPDEFPDRDDFADGSVEPPPAKKMCPYAPPEEPLNGLRPLTNCTRPSWGTLHAGADMNCEESPCDSLCREPSFRFPSADGVATMAADRANPVSAATKCRSVNIVAFLLGRLLLSGRHVPLRSSLTGPSPEHSQTAGQPEPATGS